MTRYKCTNASKVVNVLRSKTPVPQSCSHWKLSQCENDERAAAEIKTFSLWSTSKGMVKDSMETLGGGGEAWSPSTSNERVLLWCLTCLQICQKQNFQRKKKCFFIFFLLSRMQFIEPCRLCNAYVIQTLCPWTRLQWNIATVFRYKHFVTLVNKKQFTSRCTIWLILGAQLSPL